MITNDAADLADFLAILVQDAVVLEVVLHGQLVPRVLEGARERQDGQLRQLVRMERWRSASLLLSGQRRRLRHCSRYENLLLR